MFAQCDIKLSSALLEEVVDLEGLCMLRKRLGKSGKESPLKTAKCRDPFFLPGKFPAHRLLNAGKCFKEIWLYICSKPVFFLGRPLLEAGC